MAPKRLRPARSAGRARGRRLDVAVSYLFDHAENYRLSFTYANGRTDDTLEDTECWKTQFGIRF